MFSIINNSSIFFMYTFRKGLNEAIIVVVIDFVHLMFLSLNYLSSVMSILKRVSALMIFLMGPF